MKQSPIIDQLLKMNRQQVVSFHMPGHKNGFLYDRIPYKNFKSLALNLDTTEIPGTDNLHHPQGIIKNAQSRARELFGSEETYFLVNGSTAGIYSMLMAVTNPGDKVLVNRNCHQSVIHGLLLGDCVPIYVYPHMNIEQGIALGLSPEEIERCILEHPEVKAVLITYPTYHGIASDLEKIAEIVHRYNKILLVDEAHGAHFFLSDKLPKTALECGADLVVQSTHKTLPALTQSAMLHVQGNRVDREKLRFMLRLHQSSSPSYILLASLDLAVMICQTQGRELMEALLDHIDWFKSQIKEINGITLLDQGLFNKDHVKAMDPTKLWISLRQLNRSGHCMEQMLREKYSIQMELSNMYGMLAIATMGNQKQDFEKLVRALEEISQRLGKEKIKDFPPYPVQMPQQALGLRDALYRRKKTRPFKDSNGKISGTTIVPYPPGIPMVVPGERINEEMITYIQYLHGNGMEVLGLMGGEELLIEVIDDNEVI